MMTMIYLYIYIFIYIYIYIYICMGRSCGRVVTCSTCNPGGCGFETGRVPKPVRPMRSDSMWVSAVTRMCGLGQAVNVQLPAGEGNGKPPLLIPLLCAQLVSEVSNG